MGFIAKTVDDLEREWSFTTEQLGSIRSALANCALAATMDSAVRKEAEEICSEEAVDR